MKPKCIYCGKFISNKDMDDFSVVGCYPIFQMMEQVGVSYYHVAYNNVANLPEKTKAIYKSKLGKQIL